MKKTLVYLFLVLISLVAIAGATDFRVRDLVSGNIKAWINSTGTLNISQDFQCDSCINPEDVNDIDKEDIETDLNTFVDVAGDIMSGNLNMTNTGNITNVQKIVYSNSTGGNIFCVYNNGTHLIEESC